jgi:soluble lytic murein transglycosylase-like protein
MKLLSLILLGFLLLTPTLSFGKVNINIEKCRHLEEKYEVIITDIANSHNVEINLIKAIIRVESLYNSRAVSINGSSHGLMQLTKGTAKRFGVKNIYDPRENILGGVRYIVHLTSIFGKDYVRILASYNVGEGRVYKKKIPQQGKEYSNLVLLAKEKYDKR